MAYTHTPTRWLEDGMTSAAKLAGLQNAEQQYNEMVGYIDTYYHDSSYYKKSESEAKFYPKAGGREGMNAKYLGGKRLSEVLTYAIPPGIIAWTAGNVLTGWTEPAYLAGQFILCAPSGIVGWYGGSETVTATGSVTIATHTLTVAELPSHNHSWSDTTNLFTSTYAGGSGGWILYSPNAGVARTSDNAGGGQAHGHPGSTFVGSAVSNAPPYYVLHAMEKQ